jgi:hypothetical protein
MFTKLFVSVFYDFIMYNTYACIRKMLSEYILLTQVIIICYRRMYLK